MRERTTKVNPSEEAIKIGPLGIRFLLMGMEGNSPLTLFPYRNRNTAGKAAGTDPGGLINLRTFNDPTDLDTPDPGREAHTFFREIIKYEVKICR